MNFCAKISTLGMKGWFLFSLIPIKEESQYCVDCVGGCDSGGESSAYRNMQGILRMPMQGAPNAMANYMLFTCIMLFTYILNGGVPVGTGRTRVASLPGAALTVNSPLAGNDGGSIGLQSSRPARDLPCARDDARPPPI
ncbi:hypothetical protein SFRURICE_017739 [Spodoptera frugiperda]|nr:hypothetical protein SFRURICE_017739 [Spodoptera frugiperda]